ncbi:MAG TPA: hypothetical protein VJR89_40975 [Polyangiales bacterium]|nr:hypothetical protein [Polyangiales bacterium]
MDKAKAPRLVPARPHVVEDTRAYMPRIPWHYVILGVLSVSVVMGGYYLKQRAKASELREQMIRVHEVELAQARDAYTGLRSKLEDLILNAAQAKPDTLVDPRLHIPGLRKGNGLYLRLPLSAAQDKAGIEKAAKDMEPDLIGTCLGLSPASARGLYEKGEFLTPAWLDAIKKDTDVLHLRVQDEMLSRRIRADLPSVLGLTRSDWFMLVLQEGENRRDSAVRVFLWGLGQRGEGPELLLRARVQSQGVLLTTRILSKDMPARAPEQDPQRARAGAANDCSIAGQLKALVREPPRSAGDR